MSKVGSEDQARNVNRQLASLQKQLLAAMGALVLIIALSVGAVVTTLNQLHKPVAAEDLKIDVASLQPASITRGKMRYMETCATCHGPNGAGMPKQGMDLRDSKMVAQQNPVDIAVFLKKGRTPDAADSIMKLAMPPKGGNPNLSDQHLVDIVEFLRKIQKDAREEAAEDVAAVQQTALQQN